MTNAANENKLDVVYYILTKQKKICKSTFNECDEMTKIAIPPSIMLIEEKSFFQLSITEISIPSSVQSIGQSTFSECKSLTKISIPSSVKFIEIFAFSGRKSLKKVTIPSQSFF